MATKKVRQLIYFFKIISLIFFCLCWIRDLGWKKSRIRDKHPGSIRNTGIGEKFSMKDYL
jgi:hypothetical protein